MKTEDIETVVRFVRNHQTKYSVNQTENSYKITPDSLYWTSLYNRHNELLDKSAEHRDLETDLYIKEVKRLFGDKETSSK